VDRRRPIITVAAALAALATFATPAAAAVYATPDSSITGCVRATGAPGEVTTVGRIGRLSIATDLLSFGASAGNRTADSNLGMTAACAEAATGGDVTVVAAVTGATDDFDGRIRAAVREGGSDFSAPIPLGATVPGVGEVRVAVGPSGHAAVAWTEVLPDGSGEPITRVLVARRPPGGQFEKPVALTGRVPGVLFPTYHLLALGIDAAGNTTAAWAQPLSGSASFESADVTIQTSTLAPGTPPPTSRRLTGRITGVDSVSLAVSPQGRALIAWSTNAGVTAVERPGAGADFGPRQELIETVEEPDASTTKLAASTALRDDGSAAVAWYSVTNSVSLVAVEAAWRAPGGTFGGPVRVWGQRTGIDEEDLFKPASASRANARARAAEHLQPAGTSEAAGTGGPELVPAGSGPALPADPGLPGVLIAPDGTLVLAWTASLPADRAPADLAWTATGKVTDARLGSPRRLNGECRSANAIVPLLAGDGSPLVAWTDNATTTLATLRESPVAAGRVHVASPTAAPPAPAPVDLELSAPRGVQSVYYDEPVAIGAKCNGPCDLRARIPGEDHSTRAATGAVLTSAGGTRIGLTGVEGTHLAPSRRASRTRVRVIACDPVTGARVAAKTVSVRVAQRKPPPLQKPRRLRARRSGDSVVLTWSTSKPARRQSFLAIGFADDGGEEGEPLAVEDVDGDGKTRFRLRLTAKGIETIRLLTVANDPPFRDIGSTVRIEG
jgi:hypothetical protein